MFRIIPQLGVADLDASVRFYTTHLGFVVEESDPPGSAEFVVLAREETQLFLVADTGRGEATQGRIAAAPERGVGIRLYLEVDDAASEYARLLEAGVAMRQALQRSEAEDYTDFVCLDPDGYEIGIYS